MTRQTISGLTGLTPTEFSDSAKGIHVIQQRTGLSIEQIADTILSMFNINNPPSVFVIGWLGQSENDAGVNTGSFWDMEPVPDVTGTNLVVVGQLGNGNAPTMTTVTNQSIADGQASETMGALACILRDLVGSETKFVIVDLSVPGTGRPSLVNDADTNRLWSDFIAPIEMAEAEFGPVNVVVDRWYNADESGIHDFKNYFWAMYFGRNPDGSTFTLGDTYVSPGPDYVVDHCLWDADAPDDEKGRGVFAKSQTSWHIITPMPFSNSPTDGTELLNFSEGDKRLSEPDREVLHSLVNEPEAQMVRLKVGPSAHVAHYAGGIHPSEDTDPDGKGLDIRCLADAAAITAGVDLQEPVISAVSGPSSGSIAYMEIPLQDGALLTTLEDLRGQNVAYSKRFVQSLRYDRSMRGCRLPVSELKDPAVDELPGNVSYNPDNQILYVAGPVDELVGWNLSEVFMILNGQIGRMADCLITERTVENAFYIIDAYATGYIETLEWCDFVGLGESSSLAAAIWGRANNADPAQVTQAGRVGTMRRCAFFNMPTDILKTRWAGKIIENYFDTPVNLAYEPPAWDAGTTYNTGDLVTTVDGNGKRYAFKSAIDGNVGNEPPTSKTSTTEWTNQDPHVDSVNVNGVVGGTLTIAGNYINMNNSNREYTTSGYGWGINNSLRFSDSVVTPLGTIIFRNNILDRDDGLLSFPIAGPDANSDQYLDNWIVSNSGGEVFYGTMDETNTVAGNVEYDHVRELISPHKQSVMGIEIFRTATGIRRPVFQLNETSYPALYRGRVVIMDAGSGIPRKAKLAVIPEIPFDYGDSVCYLRGQATAQLANMPWKDDGAGGTIGKRDADARLYRDFLMVHHPAYYHPENAYTYEGIPVRPLQTDIQVSVPAPPFIARGAAFDATTENNDASSTTGTSLTLNQPLELTAAAGAMSFWFKEDNATFSSSKRILQIRSVDNVVRYEMLTQGGAMKMNIALQDGSNASAQFNTTQLTPGGTSFTVADWYHIAMSWTGTHLNIYIRRNLVASVALASPPWIGTLSDYGIGTYTYHNAGVAITASLAHFWMSFNGAVDFSDSEVMDMFNLNGVPQDINPDGSLPLGQAPEVYLDGDGANWNNRGTLGAFDRTGVTTAADPVPSYEVA